MRKLLQQINFTDIYNIFKFQSLKMMHLTYDKLQSTVLRISGYLVIAKDLWLLTVL